MTKKLLYVAQIDNFISFSEVSLNILEGLKKRISDEYEIFIFVIQNIDVNERNKKKVSELTGLPIENIFTIKDRKKISDKNHDVEFVHYYSTGCRDINKITLNLEPDIIFLLGDAWLLTKLIKQLNRIQNKWKGKIVPYIPIDISNLRKDLIDFDSDFFIAATEFSKRDVMKVKKNTNVYYLPHIIHQKFKKLENVKELREKYLGEENIDKFVIGSFNANCIRKRWDIILESFCKFNCMFPNSLLFIKTQRLNFRPNNLHSSGFLLEKMIDIIFNKYNVSKDCVKIMINRVPVEELNEIYNCVDLYINASDGEGFGLIPFEVAQLNKVTIMPNYSSFSTFFNQKRYNFLTDTKVYPASLIRDSDDISNIVNGNKYFCIYKSSENDVYQKVKYENGLLYSSPIIKTIIISNNGSDITLTNYNPLQQTNLFFHTKTLDKAFKIIKEMNDLPEQFQILISSDLNIIHESYETLKKYNYDNKDKKYYRSIIATDPKFLINYSIVDGYHVGLTTSNNILEKMIFYYNNRKILEKDGEEISKLVSKHLNEKIVMDKFFEIFRNENIELENK